MIQKESRLEVADNSGAKVAMVIGVLGSSTARGRFTRLSMGVGDRVVCTVKKAIPNADVKAGDKVQAVIVRTRTATRRDCDILRAQKLAAELDVLTLFTGCGCFAKSRLSFEIFSRRSRCRFSL